MPNIGSTAIVKNTIPIPPIHCVRLRQNSIPCESDSMLLSTEAPVVVKPDMVSKKASVILSTSPLSQNGIAPKHENSNHVKVTMQ